MYPAERWPFATPDAITPADITCFKSVNLLTFGPSEGTASTNNGDADLYIKWQCVYLSEISLDFEI